MQLGITTKTHPKDYWISLRIYTIKPGIFRKNADNILIVKVYDGYLNGGFRDTPFILTSKNPSPWLNTYYLQEPIAEDDPYRYYRW